VIVTEEEPLQEPVLFKQPSAKTELGAAIKRARDIMRKDAGMNGDLDRLPQFSWLLFLKVLDGLPPAGRTPWLCGQG
jgi:hypothetical protein